MGEREANPKIRTLKSYLALDKLLNFLGCGFIFRFSSTVDEMIK